MTEKSEKLVGKKVGMVQLFDEQGNIVPCSVIEVPTNYVSQIKDKEKDGYQAVQIAAFKKEKKNPKKSKKPLVGHFSKSSLPACEEVLEFRCDDVSKYTLGQELSIDLFDGCEFIDVIGTSKGKGYQGVMKKYNFSGGPAAHGSKFHRHAGSTGMRSTPGRCLPGGPRPSRMGGERKTIQNLKVVRFDKEKNLVIVKGSIPGPNGAKVIIQKATKKPMAV